MKNLFLGLFLVLGFVSVGFAQNFPDRPIRLIVAWAPGGENDILSRVFQKPFAEALRTKVYVENIPGGSTKVGTMEVMKAKPDGYTIMEHSDSSWVGLYYAQTFDFKPWEKLTPIANLTKEAWEIFEVKADSPYKTWADLVRIAKESPGKLTCGAPLSGGMLEVIFNEACKAADIKIKYVPFSGSGASLTALLGGHVDLRVLAPSGAIATIKSGKTRGLAVCSEGRMKLLPDVPTFEELGIGEAALLTRSLWGPPKLPQDITNILAKAAEKATAAPDFVKLIEANFGSTVEFRPGPIALEKTRLFEKIYGPKLAEAYK